MQSKDSSFISEMESIAMQKTSMLGDGFDQAKALSLVDSQNEILSVITRDSGDRKRSLLRHISKSLDGKIVKVNPMQEKLVMNSIGEDLDRIIRDCRSLSELLMQEKDALSSQDINRYRSLIEDETRTIVDLKKYLDEDDKLERGLINRYDTASKISYNGVMSKIVKGLGHLLVRSSWKVTVDGKENIPGSGAVVFVSRHYHGDYDGGLLYSAIPRRLFLLVGVDWIQSKIDRITATAAYKWMGAVPMNRSDSPFKTKFPQYTSVSAMKKLILLLQSREAVLIFPEAWPNVDAHYTPKQTKEEFLPARKGFIFCIEEAQRRPSEIPIVPIGLDYDESKRTITVRFGKAMFYSACAGNKSKDIQNIRDAFIDEMMHRIKALSGY